MTTIEKIYSYYSTNYILTTDSRDVMPGSIYLALKGDRFDGNQFAQQALDLGASLVIVDNDDFYLDDDRVLLVKKSLDTLQQLANYHRKVLNIPVIALTGTNGKTTTKELLKVALSTKYDVLATDGNFNNHIGVPLTILKATPGHELMIVEMGANHVGEISDLCNIAIPDIGLITNIGKAHLEGFGGYDGVVKAKSEMYHFLKSTGGTIVYNLDDNLLSNLVEGYKPSFPYNGNTDFKLLDSYPNLSFNKDDLKYTTKLVGGYNLLNIATAASVGLLMQCELKEMLAAICEYVPTNNRSQGMIKNGIHFILDAYNANPTSMQLAIKEFGEASFDNKILILGDMLELGVDSAQEHEFTIKQCLALDRTKVVFVGSIFKKYEAKYPQLKFVSSVDQLRSYVDQISPSSHCFVKGSRAIELEKIIEYL